MILKTLSEEGFYLSKFSGHEELYNQILNSKKPTESIRLHVIEILAQFKIKASHLELLYEDTYIDDSNTLHTHLIPCDFQVLIWAEDSNFHGRDFLYGTAQNIKHHKPSFGDICFMKTNDLDFIHGVSKMKEGTFVRTLIINVNGLGKNGEHVTIDSQHLASI